MYKGMKNSRLKMIRLELGLTQEQLAAKLGVGKNAVSMIETGRTALSERNKNVIVQEFNVNPAWLDTGRGPKFNQYRPEENFTRRTDHLLSLQSVPLYNIESTAGLVPIFSDTPAVEPVDYIHIPNLPRCDGAVYVAGDSMYPLLNSGDIVLYKQLSSLDDIFWGDMYLLSIDLDGEEYITVKYIRKADDPERVRLVSENPHHAEKEIAKNRIRALALIKASVRMNAMR